MLISTATETARAREIIHLVDDQPYTGREYIGSAPKPGTPGYGQGMTDDHNVDEAGPQAYLVIQPPHSTTRPHFHQTNQFQLFVAGGGRVGKLRADPLTVQYAGSHTPYGPIFAEDQGIHYFTLRQAWDSGAKYLPANNDLLEKGRQRQVVGVKSDATGPENFEIADTLQTEYLIEPTDDGLYAKWLSLPRHGTFKLADASRGGGQYHVVISGSLMRDGIALPAQSVEFASTDEGAVEVEAGPGGLQLVALRFPKG